MNQRTQKWQGGKWIRPEKRVAIYIRDGWVCSYCDNEDKEELSLDHVQAEKPLCNSATNLVTSCLYCNRSKGAKSFHVFVQDELRKKRIINRLVKPLPLKKAKAYLQVVKYLEKETAGCRF